MSTASRRIALFVPELSGGGAERITVNLARAFAERDLDVDVVMIEAIGPYVAHLPPSVRIVELGSRHTSTSVPALRRYLHHTRPQAVISALHHANVAMLIAARLSRSNTKIVVTIHSTFSMMHSVARGVRGRALPLLMRLTYPWAHGIVAVSNGVADDFSTVVGIKRERISTIYNPVVTDDMMERAKEPARHPWFHDRGPPIVMGIGRLVPQKDFSTLIYAVERARHSTPIRLLLLGEGPLRKELQSLVDDLGLNEHVSMPGFSDNPYSMLARAEVFALSSKSEGLPTVLIEALALGTPVVATRCKSGPEEILEGGTLGRLVPVGDPERLANALLDSLKEPIVLDVEAVRERFTLHKAAENYLRLVGMASNA